MTKENKPIIGIIASNYSKKNRPFNCYSKFVNNYSKRIIKSGGIPIGILNIKGMNICDGFIIQGGSKIDSEILKKIDYIVKNNKPCIGICLGMQALVAYDYLKRNNFKLINNKTLEKEYLDLAFNHNKVNPFYLNNKNKACHKVYLDKNSKISRTLKKEIIDVYSLHNYKVKDNIMKNSNLFKVIGKSNDNVIEVIESINNDFLIGVQFHPELDDNCSLLFKELIKSTKKKNHNF